MNTKIFTSLMVDKETKAKLRELAGDKTLTEFLRDLVRQGGPAPVATKVDTAELALLILSVQTELHALAKGVSTIDHAVCQGWADSISLIEVTLKYLDGQDPGVRKKLEEEAAELSKQRLDAGYSRFERLANSKGYTRQRGDGRSWFDYLPDEALSQFDYEDGKEGKGDGEVEHS